MNLVLFINFYIIFFWSNPFIIRLELIIISVLVRIFCLFFLRKWIFYVIILFYLGGLIILFLYLISLFNVKKVGIYGLRKSCNFLFLMIIIFVYRFFRKNRVSLELSDMFFKNRVVLILALLLLLVLILVVKVVEYYEGAIKCFLV